MLDELFPIEKKKVVGIVLDVSLSHVNGLRKIDVVKKAVRNVFGEKWSEEDLFYITTNPDDDRITELHEGLAHMDNFEIPVNFDACYIFKHTAWMVKEIEADEKFVFYVTDRYQPHLESQFKKIFNLDDVTFELIDVGCKNCMDYLVYNYSNVSVCKVYDLKHLEEVLVNSLEKTFDS